MLERVQLRTDGVRGVYIGECVFFMSILIVDDDNSIRKVLRIRLVGEGYDVICAANATQAYHHLGLVEGSSFNDSIDLILMDILMPDIRGIDACKAIKSVAALRDIPIILMTASSDAKHLEEAFNAGAMDYIAKPFRKVELLARLRSALRLKIEIDKRHKRERELTEAARDLRIANIKLSKLSELDGLTEVFNRRYFDKGLEKEFQRAMRNHVPLSLIMIDIDGFKAFNDLYGHQIGDQCLKKIAALFRSVINRSHDMVARYGGEEFAVVLPETTEQGAKDFAETLRSQVRALNIEHKAAPVGDKVSISLGTASVVPCVGMVPADLISLADQALYRSKSEGRNRVTVSEPA